MKVGFYCNSIEFDGDALNTRGIGGSESALINLTREWASAHPDDEIIIYNNNSGKYSEYNGVTWKSIIDFNLEIRTINLDALISLRDPEIFYMPYLDSKLKVLWSEDNMEEPRLQELAKNEYGIANIDQIFTVSHYAYNCIKKNFDTKINIVKNGYNSTWIPKNVKNKEYVAVYASTPFRGLDLLADYWPTIYKICLDKFQIKPKLKVFSSMSLYNQSDNSFNQLYQKLIGQKGVEFRGAVCQRELYNEFQNASVMLYPNTYTETFCMAVGEALANGLWVVTSDKGALNELVSPGVNGYLIKDEPGTDLYRDSFISNSITALVKNLRPNNFGMIFSWSEQAERMRKLIGEQL